MKIVLDRADHKNTQKSVDEVINLIAAVAGVQCVPMAVFLAGILVRQSLGNSVADLMGYPDDDEKMKRMINDFAAQLMEVE